MTEKFEYKGYWYLPSDPDNAVAGILTYIPKESIKLELIGTFEKSTIGIFTFTDKKSIDIILGITSNARKISLVNCHSGGGSYNFNSSFPITKYSIQYCLEGIHIEDFKEKRFSWSNITILELTTWCYPAALESIYSFSENDKKINEISVSFNTDKIKIPIISVKINNLTTLSLKKDVHYDGSKDYLNPTFKQSTFLQIQKRKKSSISDFLSDINLFEKFMSLASLSTIKVASISLYDHDNYQKPDNKDKIFHPIELFYVQRDVEKVKTKEFDFLITFSQIEDIFPEIIRKWYNDTSEITPIRSHLIQSVKSKTVFDSTDFLIVIQAIDGFCIRFRKEQKTLAKELELILDEFKDIDKIKQAKIDIKATVDSRHYYSHFMNKSKRPNSLDGLELYNLTKKLRILLICCLLNFIGIENVRINELLNKSNNSKLQ